MLDFGVNMEKFFIAGGKKLEGSVVVDTAKNAILPIIAATLLTEEEVILQKEKNTKVWVLMIVFLN